MTRLLLHGVVAATAGPVAGRCDDLFGCGKLAFVADGDLAFAASPVPAEFDLAAAFGAPDRVAAAAVAHHQILCELAVATDVVPIRIGTVVSGPAAAQDRLAAGADGFRSALRMVGGLVEYLLVATILVRADEPPPADGNWLRSRSAMITAGRDRLKSTDEAMRQFASAVAAEASLVESRRRKVREEPDRVRQEATFLVDRARTAAFEAVARPALEGLAGPILAFDMQGPWPAYSLAQGELAA
jgi:hypothetical protein